MKSLVKNLLKVGFVALVFWWLAKKNLISLAACIEGLKNWPAVLGGAIAVVATAFIAAFRWNLLLGAQEIRLATPRLLQLQFVGNFFNIALPGAVSGDFVKAFYIAHEYPGARSKAFGSILFDRILGLSALVMVSLTALLVGLQHFIGSPVLAGVKAFVMIAGLCVIVFYGYLFLVREHHDPLLKLGQRLEAAGGRFGATFGAIVRIYLGIRVYHSERKLVMKALGLSAAIHLLAGFACLCFASALGESQIPANGLFVVAPLGLLATAIPVLPGGVGTGHAAFSFFFNLLGSKHGADIFSYYVLTQLLIGAGGGFVYLRFKAQSPDVLRDMETAAG
ncbi:MAG: flippase-like domain-containing protein [Bdellovibrionales bacterium]|nr:flippase-like domain-containing protein [Bdellovibrionales bacterium]